MSRIAARLHLIVVLCCGLAAVGVAQDYEIRLVRAAKAGDRYGVNASAVSEQHMTMTVAGQPGQPRDEVLNVTLIATVEVLAVTAGGREAKSRFTIARLTRNGGPQPEVLLPVGAVVVAVRAGAKTEFTAADASVAPDVAKALGLLVTLESDQGTNDDAIFGTAARKQVGDSWPIDAAAAAADAAAKGGLKIDAANISGTTTLDRVVKDALQVSAVMTMKDVGIPLPPGMAATSSGFRASFQGSFPIDATKRAYGQTMTMRGTVECGGKVGDKELTMVMTIKQMKDVVFTAP